MKASAVLIVLAIMLGLMPSGYSIGSSSSPVSNTYSVKCTGIGEVNAAVAITLSKDGKVLNTTVGRCTNVGKPFTSIPIMTNDSPNEYQVSIVGKSNEGGTLSSMTCNLHGSTTPNVLVPLQCTIPNSHSDIFVTLVTA